MPIAVERCGGLLRHRPIARRGIQIRIDRTWLDVVDRDSAAPKLPGQRLSRDLYGSLRGRVGYQAGSQDTLADRRADHDDAAAALHVFQRRVRGGQYPADVDVDHAIHLLQGGLFERFRNGCAGVIQSTSSPPNAATVFSTALLTAWTSVASAWIATAVPPSRSIALTTAEAPLASFA